MLRVPEYLSVLLARPPRPRLNNLKAARDRRTDSGGKRRSSPDRPRERERNEGKGGGARQNRRGSRSDL